MLEDSVRAAFERRIKEILGSIDNLAEGSVRRALELVEQSRLEALDRLSRIPADSFDARHLASIRQELDRVVASLATRYQDQFPSLFHTASELGIDLIEEPFKSAGATVVPGGLIPRSTVEVLQGYSADLIQGLGNEARRQINSRLARAALGVISPQQAIQQIAGSLPSGSVFRTAGARAEAIFRTEVNRVFEVSNAARLNEMASRTEGLEKKWVAVMDFRTRETHADAHGQIVGAKELFVVGGEYAQYPRDPVLSAKESVNCRCHSVPVVNEEVLAGLGVTGVALPTF